MGSSGEVELRASDTKLDTWVHLGKAYLAPYEEGGRVHSARAVHVQVF